MLTLETQQLIIRNYRTDDFHDVYEYFSHPDVAKYEDFNPMTKEEVTHIIEKWQDQDNRLVAERKSDHKVIGSIGYSVDDNGDYSIDYDFNLKEQKKGYATEAAEELLHYLFMTVGINRIYGDCDIHNENSWKLMERLGFRRLEQIDDESYKADHDGNDSIISIYLYALDKEDYLIKHRKLGYKMFH